METESNAVLSHHRPLKPVLSARTPQHLDENSRTSRSSSGSSRITNNNNNKTRIAVSTQNIIKTPEFTDVSPIPPLWPTPQREPEGEGEAVSLLACSTSSAGLTPGFGPFQGWTLVRREGKERMMSYHHQCPFRVHNLNANFLSSDTFLWILQGLPLAKNVPKTAARFLSCGF